MTKRPSRFRGIRRAGFSLIEVTIALGIISFALVAIIGLLPVGLNSQKQGADQSRAIQVLNNVTRAVKGVRSEGGTNKFLPPLSGLAVGTGTSTLALLRSGTLASGNPTAGDDQLGTVLIQQLAQPAPGILPVYISVAWPGSARYQGGAWKNHSGTVSTLQYVLLPR